MDHEKNRDRFLRYLPLCLTAALMLACILFARGMTVEKLVSYTPRDPALAALALLVAYGVKSLSILFPVTLLYLAAGAIFPLPLAWLVNLGGLCLCITLPYGVGRFSGRGLADRLVARWPKAARVAEFTGHHQLLTAALPRVVGFLPMDAASMLLGAWGMGYGPYAAGSLLGLLPGMLIQTALGARVSDPLSPTFLGLCALMLLISLASVLLYARYAKKHRPPPSE